MNKIDFVVTWVDGNDPVWQEKKSSYDGSVNTSKQSMNSVKAGGPLNIGLEELKNLLLGLIRSTS